jgi:hypothetical protein
MFDKNSLSKMKRIPIATQRQVSIFMINAGFTRERKSIRHLRLGTDYGGWFVPEGFLKGESEASNLNRCRSSLFIDKRGP